MTLGPKPHVLGDVIARERVRVDAGARSTGSVREGSGVHVPNADRGARAVRGVARGLDVGSTLGLRLLVVPRASRGGRGRRTPRARRRGHRRDGARRRSSRCPLAGALAIVSRSWGCRSGWRCCSRCSSSTRSVSRWPRSRSDARIWREPRGWLAGVRDRVGDRGRRLAIPWSAPRVGGRGGVRGRRDDRGRMASPRRGRPAPSGWQDAVEAPEAAALEPAETPRRLRCNRWCGDREVGREGWA